MTRGAFIVFQGLDNLRKRPGCTANLRVKLAVFRNAVKLRKSHGRRLVEFPHFFHRDVPLRQDDLNLYSIIFSLNWGLRTMRFTYYSQPTDVRYISIHSTLRFGVLRADNSLLDIACQWLQRDGRDRKPKRWERERGAFVLAWIHGQSSNTV